MTSPAPVIPGPDEITLTAAGGQGLCNSRACAAPGTAAEVVVTFGTFGAHWDRNPTWPECWGGTYPMCRHCWDTTCAVLEQARPGLTVRQVRP